MTPLASRRPDPSEHDAGSRIQLAELPGEDVFEVLEGQIEEFRTLAASVGPEEIDRVHDGYGWSVRQVFEHCVDADRVFGYRAMRLAAGDATPLPAWDETAYAASGFGLNADLEQLFEEFRLLRQSLLLLLRRLEPAAWDRAAECSGHRVTVRACAWITAAHLHHHLRIVRTRLGVPAS